MSAPRHAILFAGHMVDAPDRAAPRFPERWIDLAAARIGAMLDEWSAGPQDLAYTQGACGGDLLFTEACRARRVPVQWMQPFAEPVFIERSVALRGAHWRARYERARATLDRPPLPLPPPSHGTAGNPFERCNRWLLARALEHGAKRLRVMVLWNGEDGDAPGGTDHLVGLARRVGGRVYWIDTRVLAA